MSKAKTYIYRNLNCGGFSAKYKGKVVNRFGYHAKGVSFVIDPKFQVSQAVSAKIKVQKKRQVHAYVVTDSTYSTTESPPKELFSCPTLKYNPHVDTEFHSSDGRPLSEFPLVVFFDSVAYLVPITEREVCKFAGEVALYMLDYVSHGLRKSDT